MGWVLMMARLVYHQLFSKLPDDHACCRADIEGVFSAKLRNLYTIIGGINHFLMHTFHFIAQDDGISSGLSIDS